MNTPSTPSELYLQHEETINKAIKAVHDRSFFAHYPEPPSKRIYGENANADGMAAYKAQLGSRLELLQNSDSTLVSDESSPYTGEALKIEYPVNADPTAYVTHASQAFAEWKSADVKTRAGILVESLDRISRRFFELAYATMHTTGQAFMMSFQASGPHANDRALEAIALGVHEQSRFPSGPVEWIKPAGKVEIHMEKRYLNIPRGVGLCIGVSTFPVWNTVPGLYADLITGNPAIVKPHPMSVYPIAIVVQELQQVLQEHGFSPNIAQLATDVAQAPITKVLAEHPDVKLIDYTGGNVFGDYVERLPGKITFTEKAGVNSVIIDSCDDLKAMLGNLSFSVSMYSGQMCTAPQNFFIPADGIDVDGKRVSFDEVAQGLAAAIKGLVSHPKMGPGVLGTIQNPLTIDRAKSATGLGATVLLDMQEIENPDFPNARMASPVVLQATSDQVDLFSQELFGPVLFVIKTASTTESIRLAKKLALEKGAISCSAYTTVPEIMEKITTEMSEAYTPVSFNFTGNFWVNQNAGFSDFHVTGGNPAGNASLTDPEFVLKRFARVGTRVYKPQPAPQE